MNCGANVAPFFLPSSIHFVDKILIFGGYMNYPAPEFRGRVKSGFVPFGCFDQSISCNFFRRFLSE